MGSAAGAPLSFGSHPVEADALSRARNNPNSISMLLSLLVAALVASDSVPTGTVESDLTAQGVALAVHHQPAVPLVALRLSLMASDPPGYAGAGHLYQHIVHPTLTERAAQIGARVLIERSADAVVFTVTGSSLELPHMAAMLRDALSPETIGEVQLLRVSRELAEERLAEWETAERHVRSVLRLRLFPEDISAAGTEPSAARLAERNGWRTAWTRMYRPDRVSITTVGDVRMDQVKAAFGSLPPAAEVRSAPQMRDTVSTVPLAPAEATRAWIGAGYLAGDVDPAVLSVATRILNDRLRQQLPNAGVVAEHWWTHHGQAVALVASVPGAQLAAAQRTMNTTVAGTAPAVTAAQVSAAATAIRRDLLFFSRTPDRMVGVIGQFSDRTGNPDEAQIFFDRLSTVTLAQVRAALTSLQAGTTARIEIPPQRLIRR
jgi:predicted Zn-dependent peptidase